MNPILFQAGGAFAALALIGYTIVSFLTGAAYANGAVVREGVKPLLESIRANSDKSRSDLADATLLVAVAFSAAGMLTDGLFAGGAFAVLLMLGRTTVQKMTSSEHPLMSLGSQFSADLIIGVLVPMALAHIVVGNWFLAASHLAVSLSLSWPTGGAGRRTGAWKPSWVGA